MKNNTRLILIACLSITWVPCGIADQAALNTQQTIDFLSSGRVTGNQNGAEWIQMFAPGGYTSYQGKNGLRPASGRWMAPTNNHCSRWTPAEQWLGYVFTAEGNDLVLIPDGGGDPWSAV